jgi:hypothetical protein
MGCENSKTIEIKENKSLYSIREKMDETKPNLIKKILKGYLQGNFKDCLITNKEQLEDYLVSFIPTKIRKEDNEFELIHNINDDILTQSIEINFEDEYIIALSGLNEILKVEEYNGNYLVFYDKEGDITKYIAIFVSKLNDFSQILFCQIPNNQN